MKKLFVPIILLFLCSCDKNKEMVRYTELYHIEGNDTISAIYFPNTFTPDGDAINDQLIFHFNGFINDGFELSIFDTYGTVIFQTINRDYHWDGTYYTTVVQSDFYNFRIQALDTSGFKFDFFGKVQLLK